MWIRVVEKRIAHDMEMEKLAYTAPARMARRGQFLGLIAVLAVLFLAGYAFYLDHPWAGAVLTAIDVVALAAVFVKPGDDPQQQE